MVGTWIDLVLGKKVLKDSPVLHTRNHHTRIVGRDVANKLVDTRWGDCHDDILPWAGWELFHAES